jgi:hypothetical protein
MTFKRSKRDFIESMIGFTAIPALWGYGLFRTNYLVFWEAQPLWAFLAAAGFLITLSFPFLTYKSFQEIIEVRESGLYLGKGLRKETFTPWQDFREVTIRSGYRRQMTVKSRPRPQGFTFGFLLDKEKMEQLEEEIKRRLGDKVPWSVKSV